MSSPSTSSSSHQRRHEFVFSCGSVGKLTRFLFPCEELFRFLSITTSSSSSSVCHSRRSLFGGDGGLYSATTATISPPSARANPISSILSSLPRLLS
ncbi:hypothetical protein RIF29_15028 [Crotalaria pallida]|uniref:Uncharacterized protein n=1 Tax=Crotalaria pallida TaxID=3830 RepID=A0AAN9FI91_CROPI